VPGLAQALEQAQAQLAQAQVLEQLQVPETAQALVVGMAQGMVLPEQ